MNERIFHVKLLYIYKSMNLKLLHNITNINKPFLKIVSDVYQMIKLLKLILSCTFLYNNLITITTVTNK